MRWAAVALLLAGCFDFATPAELEEIQLLAVRATPKAVPAGERAALDFLIGGPDGMIEGTDPSWTVVDSLELPAFGDIVREGDAFFYRAPAAVAEPTGVSLRLTVVADGMPLTALKAIGIGLPPIPNPVIGELTVAGVPVEGDSATVVRNASMPLAATLEPDAGDMTQLAWYSTVGEIDPIRGGNTEITVEAGATGGPLVVVGRDGLGGVAWRVVTLELD